MPLLPSGLQGRRSKRVAAQTNTTDREATLAGDLLLQRSNKLQTELRASDSKGQDDMLWGTTDLDHTDEEGLRFAGYRGQAFFEQLDHDTSGRTMEICVCKHQVSSDGEDVEAEDLMRCSVRDCNPGWFHHHCVGLPEHPPMHLGWMCPACILSQRMTGTVNGLWDLRRGEDVTRAREWLKEMKLERSRFDAREKQFQFARERFWRELHEED
ncbi:hypothetical protein CKM354_000144600 [Cercospora kikuchii]|uniref:Zinc finger PHD-type domain-containing protein n=1 Tax=Cercospora kikuchii TaxID=84275 RepID=A0A9P3C5T0_9PEZI|nr:uncharacterized protein CKM354_000144600 [Cercospora kikuchii]GIZ38019.1 hypothetical protein CKM354_000144600 [Cercospora kikuchii]